MGQTAAERRTNEPALTFRELNRGKALQRLDLRTPDGAAALIKLVRGADVLVEGFRPGVMDKFGLGWETLRAVNPKLVMCAISAAPGRIAPATTSTTSRWPACWRRSPPSTASSRCRISRLAT